MNISIIILILSSILIILAKCNKKLTCYKNKFDNKIE